MIKQASKLILPLFLFFYPGSLLHGQSDTPSLSTQILQLEKETDSLYKSEDYERVRPKLITLIKISEEAQKWATNTKAQIQLAVVYFFSEQNEKALVEIQKAITTAKQHLPPADSLLGRAYSRQGEIQLEAGLIEEAILSYQQAFPIVEKSQDWEDAAYIKVGMAVAYFHLSQYQEMEQALKSAERIQRQYLPQNNSLQSLVLHLLGAAYDSIGDFDGALNTNLKAINAYAQQSQSVPIDSLLLSTYYNNIGATYHAKGDFDKAIIYYQNTIAIRENAKDSNKKLIGSYNNLAITYSAAGNLEASLAILNKSLSLLNSSNGLDVAEDFSLLYNTIARNYIQQEDGGNALRYAQKALKYQKAAPQYAHLTLRRIAEAYLLLGDEGQSLLYLNEAEKSCAQHNSAASLHRAVILGIKSKAYLQAKQPELALQYAQQALQLLYPDVTTELSSNPAPDSKRARLEGIKILQLKARALSQITQNTSEQASDHLSEALSTYDLLFSWTDSIRQQYLSTSSKQLLTKETRLAYEQAINICLMLNKQTNDQKYLYSAFLLVERNKAIILQERFQDNKAKWFANIPDSLLQEEIDVKRDLAFYNRQILEASFSEQPDEVKLNFWRKKVLSLNQKLDSIIASLEHQYPAYFQLKYQLPELSIADLRDRMIHPHSLLLEYFVGEDDIFLFIMSHQGIEINTIKRAEDFENQILAFRQMLTSPPTENQKKELLKFSQSAYDLYALLLEEPLQKYPEKSHLYIIPDYIISYIPFEVLISSNSINENNLSFAQFPYLFLNYKINYCYSSRLLLNVRSTEASLIRNPRCLAFAPDFSEPINQIDSPFSSISNNKLELEAIEQYFNGQFLYADQAIEATFKTHASNFDIVHLATHGISDKQSPLFSKVIFHQGTSKQEDNILHTFELYNMLLNARLVVLSACESGYGTFAFGEEVMSLASGFMHTGCSNITMSLWKAQDNATAKIMEFFYAHLSRGIAIDEALALAKQDYLKDPMAQKHPYYWAALVNIGDGEAFVKPGYSNWLWGLLAIPFLLLFFIKKSRRFFKSH